IKTIMVLRALFLAGFVILIFLFQKDVSYHAPVGPLSAAIGAAFFLSMIYALLLKQGRNLFLVASVQVAGDLSVVGGVVYSTGGIESPLSFLYSLAIIATSVMLPRAATYLAASVASISYGLLIDLEYYNVIDPVYFFIKSRVYDGGYVFYIIFINIASFYSVAFLSSLLSHRLRLIKEELAVTSSDLKELQVFHRNVVQNMGNGLLTTGLDGKITSMNPAAEEIAGQSIRESLGKPCHLLLPLAGLEKFFAENTEARLPKVIEGECVVKGGKPIFVRIKISRLIEDRETAQAKGYICVFEDLTEIRNMEKKIAQTEQLAALGRFSAGLAHEIRNPLASLSGSIQVLYKGLDLEENYRRLMEIVVGETDRLNRIVTDFLHYAHPRKKRETVVDLTQLVLDALALIKNSADYNPSINLEFESPSGHLLINSDEQLLRQVIWNLCINGMQAMPLGGTLKVVLEKTAGFRRGTFQTGQSGLVLTVQDEGEGIPPENAEKIFQPFYTTKDGGFGLGLATVRQIVENMGGFIAADSQAAKGARFVIFLPCAGFPVADGR
ncbi:MAG: PAS domain-containing protein, partial [Nitrospinae bacterium]|nr:PAS domain-containing protein [Nitrospinota bacterium]